MDNALHTTIDVPEKEEDIALDITPVVPTKKKIIKKKFIENTNNDLLVTKETTSAHEQNTDVPINNKKLSRYHAFIKAYLADHSEIVWNKRMQAANEAWKIEKIKLDNST